MNAIETNSFTRTLGKLGERLAKPKAVLCVSAHWLTEGTKVTGMAEPRTIHDFGGFPDSLYQVRYPAPGSPELAALVRETVGRDVVAIDEAEWGLDHGSWSVLRHLYPKADVPVVQLSIDENQPASFHYDIGERLAPLREEGILIIGSGNLVHNLHAYAWGQHTAEPYEWAVSFERRVRDLLLSGESKPLIGYENELGKEAMLAVPTPDHYLPLLYVIGTRTESDPVSFPVEGVDGGSISMLTVRLG